MKILLLGATGRTGRLVLDIALNRGYDVNCLVRNSEYIKNQTGLTLFEGNPNRKSDIENALSGCDAVISVLNISRKSDIPWAPLSTPINYLSEVMHHVVSVMKKEGVNRIVVCSAWGVADSKNDIPKWFKWLIENSNIRFAYQDHERQEKIITDSGLDWTIVRPVGLTNSNKLENIKETINNNNPRPSLTISRTSLAHYLVDSLAQQERIGKKIVISKE